MSSIKVPSDASINVQDAFRTVKDVVRGIEARLEALGTTRGLESDISSLKAAVVELAKKPTYRSWEDVFGNFPRVDNLFAAFLIAKGNVSTGEQVLVQKEFDYRELPVGKVITAVIWGRTVNTANSKTLRVRVLEGAHNTIVAAFSLAINEVGNWTLLVTFARTSDVLLRVASFVQSGLTSGMTRIVQNVTQPTALMINPLVLQVTGEGTASDDISLEAGFIPRMETNVEVFQTTTGNVLTGEDTLAEKILRTGTLFSNGQSLRGVFWGQCANNANAKTLRLRIIESINNTVLISRALTINQVGHWVLAFQLLRTDTASLRSVGQVTDGQANTNGADIVNVSQMTSDTANAITIRLTGDATATDDITVEGGVIPDPENVISTVLATVGNVGAAETVLSDTVLGASGVLNNIDTDGRAIRGIYWGHTTNNANAKVLFARLIEGANNNVLVSVALTTNETGHWILTFNLLRKSSAGLVSEARIVSGPSNTQATASAASTKRPVATLANAITIRISGQGVATNDITLEGGSLSFVP